MTCLHCNSKSFKEDQTSIRRRGEFMKTYYTIKSKDGSYKYGSSNTRMYYTPIGAAAFTMLFNTPEEASSLADYEDRIVEVQLSETKIFEYKGWVPKKQEFALSDRVKILSGEHKDCNAEIIAFTQNEETFLYHVAFYVNSEWHQVWYSSSDLEKLG